MKGFDIDGQGWRQRRREAAHLLEDAAQRAADAVERTARTALVGGDRALGQGVDLYRQGNRAVTARLGDNVVPTLLLAAAAGYAIAWFLHSRPRRR